MWIDDQVVKHCSENLFHQVWLPKVPIAVLGSSNQPEVELNLDAIRQNPIDVYKRYGGGGSVILYPGCIVLSLGCWVKKHFENKLYFQLINEALLDLIREQPYKKLSLSQKGISDLCIGEKKFVGTSMFRSRNYLLFQASILCRLDIELIERYLTHPSKEPDYRCQRRHRDFLTGLCEEDSEVDPLQLCKTIETDFPRLLKSRLKSELIDAKKDQCPHLLKKIASDQESNSPLFQLL